MVYPTSRAHELPGESPEERDLPRSKTTNICGVVVDEGMHVCRVCGEKKNAIFMRFTAEDGPKLCEACYRAL